MEKDPYTEELEHLLRQSLWTLDYLAAWLPGRIPDEEVARIRDLAVTISDLIGGDTDHIRRVAERFHAVCPPFGS
jgi:DNA-binding GntR family transcriptional regulator